MYCRLPNAVQPCPKRAPCFVRQTFQRVRVSAIINPLPLHLGLDQQFSFSRIFPSSNIYFIRDSIKITLFFLIFEVSHVFRITLGLLFYHATIGRSLETTHALLRSAFNGLDQPPTAIRKEKKKKKKKKGKTIDAAKRTVATKEGGMGRKGILARGYHDLSRYKVENVDDRASSRRFHVADARQKASTAAKIIGAFPLIPDTRVTRSISME